MGVGQLSESDAVDALRLPLVGRYKKLGTGKFDSVDPTGSHGWRNQFDLGNPD